MRACWSRARGIAFCVAWCMGCSRDPARADGSIDCPVGWVAHSRGGCGPAVLACSESDAAASGACASWRSGASDGGGVADDGRGPFDLSPDGAILGRWVEPHEHVRVGVAFDVPDDPADGRDGVGLREHAAR